MILKNPTKKLLKQIPNDLLLKRHTRRTIKLGHKCFSFNDKTIFKAILLWKDIMI